MTLQLVPPRLDKEEIRLATLERDTKRYCGYCFARLNEACGKRNAWLVCTRLKGHSGSHVACTNIDGKHERKTFQ